MSDYLGEVVAEFGFKPSCVDPNTPSLLWDTPQGRPKREIEAKRAICAGCLGRLECLTDAINYGLGATDDQDVEYYGVVAGHRDLDLRRIAARLREAGTASITPDEAEQYF